jgi:UDP-N-acetylglucosamine diphosphorylase / glucose-1-phosphate thymidylyltransferase / UDP-N-acetylgalactosamine diphosphorylase / glucosamine-1-phosphate N-acetyltransferase / galactosamine-1-phosphate N-acetyltransferase
MTLQVLLYEDEGWQRFLPLTYGRAVFQLVCGMGDLAAKVRRLAGDLDLWCRPELADLIQEQTGASVNRPLAGEGLLLNGRALWESLPPTRAGESAWVGTVDGKVACIYADATLATVLEAAVLLDEGRLEAVLKGVPRRDVGSCARLLDWPWDLVHAHPKALVDDWQQTAGTGIFGETDEGASLLSPSAIHLGRGSRLYPGAVIDAEAGPVWIGDRVRVLPHSYIQGPAYIGDGSLRSATFVGPLCKVGGEIEGSILHGFSNKQHDGFLGHSYVGPWVNIGAGCSNSDLKNTYGSVRVPIAGRTVDSGETFVGALVGDHAKLGINLAVPTGATIGFCASVAAANCPKFVPSFTWLAGGHGELYDAERGLEVARQVMARRGRVMSAAEAAAFLAAASLSARLEQR